MKIITLLRAKPTDKSLLFVTSLFLTRVARFLKLFGATSNKFATRVFVGNPLNETNIRYPKNNSQRTITTLNNHTPIKTNDPPSLVGSFSFLITTSNHFVSFKFQSNAN